MKLLLLNSPIYREKSDYSENYLPPIGLGYIATHANKAGIDVDLLDCVNERLGVEEIKRLISANPPDYLGVNVFTQNIALVKEIILSCPTSVKVLLGGQVVSSIYSNIPSWNPKIQIIVIIGEGEFIVPDIINGHCRTAPFLCVDNCIVYNVDKESAYYPANLSDVHLNRIFLKDELIENHYGQNEATIITSRGCVYDCAFCGGARSLNTHLTIRFRSKNDIEGEIAELVKLYPSIESIRIADDLFLRNANSIQFAIDLFSENKLSWRAMAHVLSFVNNTNTIASLRTSGCKELFMGIESGSPVTREQINKAGTIEETKLVISEILNAGIDVKGYFIFGFPEENPSDADLTLQLAAELRKISFSTEGIFRTSVFQFRPYHGTQLYKKLIEQGYRVGEMLHCATGGKKQFDFQSGNYSNIDDETLNNYIRMTLALNKKAGEK
jgi:radical SAM superfamily enzyme YgiQ (UPF0313 family)